METEKSQIPIQVKATSVPRIIKETAVDTFSNSTAHALPNILRHESIILKIIWLILFLAGIGGCIYYLYDSLNKYFSYEVSVSVKWNEMTLQTFPAVTFCNLNPFDTSQNASKVFLEQKLKTSNLNWNITASEAYPAIYQVTQTMKVLKASALSEHKTNGAYFLGFDINSMLISCYFNGIKCTTSDFTQSYSFEYGSCYSFNLNGSKTTSKTGSTSGLSLEIFTGFPNVQDFFIEQRGIYLNIHNSSRKPMFKFDGIKLSVGQSSNVAIKRTFSYRKESPFSDCRVSLNTSTSSDSIYVNKTIAITQYSTKLCFEICLQSLYLIPNCGCSDPSIPVTETSVPVCSTLEKLNCIDNIRNKFDSTDLSLNCSKVCPTECDRVMYETTVSASDYPTRYYYDIISNQANVISKFSSFGNVSYNLFKESVLMVNVYYQELGYTTIKESAMYTGESIFATIGGQLGFLMGLSLLSFCEIIIFFIDVTIRLIKSKLKKTKKK